ncbi:MAG: putative T4-like protein proximal tail fiber [Candidatus Magasanikbacteria bacterium GW2011_GWC2_37_14]|uniref:Putative T4-like protein proximal tail fiber n=1 Tax=Candidatus Magasanikbacteria bacterium GW2011_GWC2_37_14 TaxID=1619046 RepID=A0A0G0GA86_9BACT|nr:MAG: putative T4-like protein proximal tail fiber [Candidatus Magasanikbacteria bacterium GW2011_GWC2_37_14]
MWLKSGVYVSSTLITSGNVTLGDTSADVLTINANIGSSLLPSVNNNYDLGSYGNAWKDIYASGTLRIGSTSILDTNSLKIGTASGFDAGKFYVNSAGNVSTSGTLHTYGSTVLDGNVSIGTTTLDYTLTVDGNIAIAGGSLFIDESRTLSGSYNNQNIFVGPAAGLNSTGNDNVFVGYVSGFNNSGVGNAFLGSTVGSDNTGDYNTYFGMNSGYANTSGGNNVFLGAFTGRLNQTGSQNVYVGRGSGWSATSSVGNVFLGYQAGYSETGSNKLYIDNSNTAYPLIYGDFSSADLTVNGNLTATGTFSATSNTSSLRSVKLSSLGSAPDTTAGNIYFNSTTGQFYGYTANGTAVDLGATGSGGSNWSYDTNYGTSVITPSSTIPVWLKSNLYVSSSINVSGALNLPTTDASGNGVVNINGVRFMHAAGGNTFLGRYAGNLSTIGVRNVGLGYSALPSVTGDGNVAVGASALSNTVDGSYNVAIGDWALYNNSAGSANVIIGYQAGGGNIAGSGNIFVGNQAGYSETGSNKLYIANSNTASPLIYGDFASAAITINGNLTATGTFSATSNTSSLRSLKLSSLGSAPDTTAGNIYFNSSCRPWFYWFWR